MIITRTLNDAPLPKGGFCIALGLFDGLHRGHRAVLDAALEESALNGLEPAVFTFQMPHRRPEGKRTVTALLSEESAERILLDMGIARVIRPEFEEFCDFSPADFVGLLKERLGAACVVCGYSFRFGKGAAGDSAELTRLCGERGIRTRMVPAVSEAGEPVSSSRIRALIEAGDVSEAAVLLGRRFAIDFPVITGRRLGRKLGWPTINQAFPDGFTVPKYGVYATLSTVNGKVYGSVTNVGLKPTVGSERVLAETYVHDFEGDLYGRKVPVEFLEFLRAEQKFGSVQELADSISRDVQMARIIGAPILGASHARGTPSP